MNFSPQILGATWLKASFVYRAEKNVVRKKKSSFANFMSFAQNCLPVLLLGFAPIFMV
jgi:hypothetical protein